jgi:hypothetical protein
VNFPLWIWNGDYSHTPKSKQVHFVISHSFSRTFVAAKKKGKKKQKKYKGICPSRRNY